MQPTETSQAPTQELRDVEDLLIDAVCMMVDREKDVRIDFRYPEEDLVFADIHVHDFDVGLVLGSKGTRSRALQEVFGAMYGKLRKRLTLYVVPTGPRVERRSRR